MLCRRDHQTLVNMTTSQLRHTTVITTHVSTYHTTVIVDTYHRTSGRRATTGRQRLYQTWLAGIKTANISAINTFSGGLCLLDGLRTGGTRERGEGKKKTNRAEEENMSRPASNTPATRPHRGRGTPPHVAPSPHRTLPCEPHQLTCPCNRRAIHRPQTALTPRCVPFHHATCRTHMYERNANQISGCAIYRTQTVSALTCLRIHRAMCRRDASPSQPARGRVIAGRASSATPRRHNFPTCAHALAGETARHADPVCTQISKQGE